MAAALPSDFAALVPKPKAEASDQTASNNPPTVSKNDPGIVCKTEYSLGTFFTNGPGGIPTATSYNAPHRVCRKNGKRVDAR